MKCIHIDGMYIFYIFVCCCCFYKWKQQIITFFCLFHYFVIYDSIPNVLDLISRLKVMFFSSFQTEKKSIHFHTIHGNEWLFVCFLFIFLKKCNFKIIFKTMSFLKWNLFQKKIHFFRTIFLNSIESWLIFDWYSSEKKNIWHWNKVETNGGQWNYNLKSLFSVCVCFFSINK